MKQFKIRASQIGQIMTNPRSKSETLSETCKSYCEEWVKEQLYNRRKEVESKYFDKGIACEQSSIDFIGRIKGIELFKNETQFETELITGMPDVLLPKYGIEIKNSWSPFTFPLFDAEPDKKYWWQCQGYMELTGLPYFELTYTLTDSPEELIMAEAKRYCYKNGMSEVELDIYDSFVAKITYSDIPDNLKIKVFRIDRDEAAIESIKARVLECRFYINNMLNNTK